MSRCVALGIAESSGQFYLSRCLNIRHRDRETVERDSGYSHWDRLSPRNETNRNVSLAVLYFSDNCGKLEASYVVGARLVVSPLADPNDLVPG